MLYSMVKLMGLNATATADATIWLPVAIALAILVGFFIDAQSEHIGFGPFGNAFVMGLTGLAGLFAYARYIEPLRNVASPTILLIAIGSAVTGFLILSYAKSVTIA